MPIVFKLAHSAGYVICTFSGKITDQELLASWEKFYASDLWIPGFNELVIVGNANVAEVTSRGIRNLAELAKQVNKKHNITSIKVAIYAPQRLSYGLARMYNAITSDSPENTRVFDDRQAAENWLREKGK